MALKTLCASAIVVSTVAIGCLASAPAQAAIIGSITFDSRVDVLEPTANTATFQNFASFQNVVADGIFTGYLPTQIQNLSLTRNSAGFYESVGLSAWKTYTNASGQTITFDLAAGALFQRIANNIFRTYVSPEGSPFNGVYNLANGTTVSGFGVVQINDTTVATSRGNANFAQVAIPTPALLPGLVGFGIAALRKRKQEATAPAEA